MKLTRIPSRLDFQLATVDDFDKLVAMKRLQVMEYHTTDQHWKYTTLDGFVYGVNYQ